jgi:succinyl-CoA synthetase beta subunit
VKIHEYQAKEVLAGFGIPVPAGRVASTVEEAVKAGAELGGGPWVVKAQIHAGGRGKGGGVKVARTIADVEAAAARIIGMQLVTPQTGPAGRKVKKVLVAEACEIEREHYAGIVLDRKVGMPVLMASAEGGVEIEEVAARSPEKIFKEPFSPLEGLQPYQGRRLAKKLGLGGKHLGPASSLFVNLARAFLDTDASLAEVNPLVLTRDGRLLALDAKLSFDDNGLFRHAHLREYRDLDEEDPQEVRASRFDLSYIKMEGDIGCMVNGAGLAMATLDIIQHWGGSPANFLDVGGGATREKVTEAFKIILEDPNVKAILVNIFGGIMKCDVIAEGIIAAARTTALAVPLVVRLEGTNVEKGKDLLAASGLGITLAVDLSDAARKVAEKAKERS